MSLLNTLEFIVRHPLNREHKLDALVRFAKWQVGSRLTSGPTVFDWVNGSKFSVMPGETGLTGNIYAGLRRRTLVLKRLIKRSIDPLLARAWQLGPLRRRGESYDVAELATLIATIDSAQYFVQHMQPVKLFDTDLDLLAFAARTAGLTGLALEFGVASGRTIRHLAGLLDLVHGFDVFSGLPEDWRPGFEAGRFAQPPPEVPANVSLHEGLFADTLPAFLAGTDEPVSLVHVDCDLYSATRDVLSHLAPRLRPGSVIVFDEYFNYPGWREHEYKAFQEYVAAAGTRYRYLGVVPSHQQAAVMLL